MPELWNREASLEDMVNLAGRVQSMELGAVVSMCSWTTMGASGLGYAIFNSARLISVQPATYALEIAIACVDPALLGLKATERLAAPNVVDSAVARSSAVTS